MSNVSHREFGGGLSPLVRISVLLLAIGGCIVYWHAYTIVAGEPVPPSRWPRLGKTKGAAEKGDQLRLDVHVRSADSVRVHLVNVTSKAVPLRNPLPLNLDIMGYGTST